MEGKNVLPHVKQAVAAYASNCIKPAVSVMDDKLHLLNNLSLFSHF